MHTINGLGIFPKMDGLPRTENDQVEVFQSDVIKKVVCFSLGPEGTNIVQASRLWLNRMHITRKAEVCLYDTPEACLKEARRITENGVVAIFWTCAVYAHESEFFFGNPDVLPFFTKEVMLLDEMQLATTPELALDVINGRIPEGWKISSHPSPQHLLKYLDREIILVNSNSAAAKHCKDGLSSACITTESARKIYNLATLHMFGSPPMVFFGGITGHGAKVVKKAFEVVRMEKENLLSSAVSFSS